MAVAKEQIRQMISENNISSVADVYAILKDSFKDILRELMEAELDSTLGYEKIIREICRQTIKETPKYQRDISGIEPPAPESHENQKCISK